MKKLEPGWEEFLCGQGFFLAAGFDVGIREVYHRSWTEVRLIVLIFGAWLAWSLIMLVLLQRWGWVRSLAQVSRMAFIVACASSMAVLAPNFWQMTGMLQWLIFLAAFLVVARFAALSVRSALWGELWGRARMAATVAVVLFVASQPILGRWAAPHYTWLSQSTAPAVEGPRSITVILLMDELNAQSAPSLASVFAIAGLRTQFQAVTPAGPHTAQAVPAMFAGHQLRNAKACGPTAMCSMDGAMDFSKVTVTRPDVDIVGFFHPYCAIRDLRYCKRSVQPLPLLDWKRWECLWRRQLMVMDRRKVLECESVYIRSWMNLKEDVLGSMWQAPVWTKGGTIYAHLPMPHPPGRTPGAGLAQHYRENLNEVASVLAAVTNKAKQVAPGHVRIIVISDHPLRQSMWCATQFPYPQEGCTLDSSLVEEEVPVIVADSDHYFGSLEGLHTNLEVFRWIATDGRSIADSTESR